MDLLPLSVSVALRDSSCIKMVMRTNAITVNKTTDLRCRTVNPVNLSHSSCGHRWNFFHSPSLMTKNKDSEVCSLIISQIYWENNPE